MLFALLMNVAGIVCGACGEVMLDAHGQPRTQSPHSCLSCKKSLHSYVVCSAVHVPVEGAYYCSQACESGANVVTNSDDEVNNLSDDADQSNGMLLPP